MPPRRATERVMAGYCRAFRGTSIILIDSSPGDPASRGDSLSTELARRSGRRLRAVRRRIGALPRADAVPHALRVLDGLTRTLRVMPRPDRVRILIGPDVRGFLAEADTWLEARRWAAMSLARRTGRGADARRGHGASRAVERLFDVISRTEHLVTLVPRGRLDAGFARRCRRFARSRLVEASFDLAALALGLRLAYPRAGPAGVVIRFREDAGWGRPPDRIDLGAFAGAGGPLGIVFAGTSARAGPGSGALRIGPRARVRATVRDHRLELSARGPGRVIVPAAGTPLNPPEPVPARRPRRGRGRGPALRLVRREVIPGSSIILASRVVSSPHRPRVTGTFPGLGRRLERALGIVRVSWPEAHREIERRTFMLVPIREPGTVSYSVAARPGLSFINPSGKTLVDLADDLLHETAHHRLHDLQAVAVLLKPGPETLDVQAFDSPWRGALRPLHGLLHGAYTFLFRAELFRRILRLVRLDPRALGAAIGPPGRSFLLRELGRERRMIARALRDLEAASRAGLLTRAGRGLVRGMRVWSRRL